MSLQGVILTKDTLWEVTSAFVIQSDLTTTPTVIEQRSGTFVYQESMKNDIGVDLL